MGAALAPGPPRGRSQLAGGANARRSCSSPWLARESRATACLSTVPRGAVAALPRAAHRRAAPHTALLADEALADLGALPALRPRRACHRDRRSRPGAGAALGIFAPLAVARWRRW